MAIKNAKYRVKNSEGTYDVVHFETGMEQVQGLNEELGTKADEASVDQRFQTANGIVNGLNTRLGQVETGLAQEVIDRKDAIVGVQEVVATKASQADLNAEIARAKAEEARLDGLVEKAQKEVDALEVVVGNNKTAIEETVSTLNGKVDSYITSNNIAVSGLEGRLNVIEPKVSTLEGEMDAVELEIRDLKAAIADKNSNTLVYSTMSEFLAADLAPKTGDLAFVIDVKKAFIYKGEAAISTMELPTPPAGWVLFDEISTEIDLKDYAKKVDVEAADTALNTKIVNETNRATQVEGELRADITKEISDRKTAITGVEGQVSVVDGKVVKEVADRVAAVKLVDDAVKALDSKVNNAAQVVGAENPSVSAPVGHVWIEILG